MVYCAVMLCDVWGEVEGRGRGHGRWKKGRGGGGKSGGEMEGQEKRTVH